MAYGDHLYLSLQSPRDIIKFLESDFLRIYNSDKHADDIRFIPKPWPPPRMFHQLVKKFEGHFIRRRYSNMMFYPVIR